MVSLQDKYYGLSVLSWLIILILIVLFYFTLSDNSSSSPSSSSPSPSSSSSSKQDSALVKETFTQNKDKDVKVYNFNTTWCGYSVRFQPEWSIFEEEVKAKGNLSHVKAYDIKCDDPEFEQMCKNYEVPGFPTIIIQKGPIKKVYQGPRTAKSIIETIEAMEN